MEYRLHYSNAAIEIIAFHGTTHFSHLGSTLCLPSGCMSGLVLQMKSGQVGYV